MLSTKPYLVRAFYEWINDSAFTPYIVINANYPRCNVPLEYVENGEIVFNISPQAIRDLKIGNETLEFRASFSGIIQIISAPIKAILAIYAEENGQGMFFDAEDEEVLGSTDGWGEQDAADFSDNPPTSPKGKKQYSHLKLVE